MRLRWFALGVWWVLLRGTDQPALQPAADHVFLFGLGYCGVIHFLTFRNQKVRSLSFAVILADTAFVLVLCGVSGGIHSPAYLYVYGLILATTIRLGKDAGLILAGISTVLTLGLFFFTPQISVPPLSFETLSLKIFSLFGLALLSGVLLPHKDLQVRQAKPTQATPKPLRSALPTFISLDVDSLMQQLVDTTLQLFPCHGACFILLSPRTLQAERVATAGQFPAPTARDLTLSLATGGILREALEQGPIWLDSPSAILTRLHGIQTKHLAQRNLLITPLAGPKQPQPVGCLLLADSRTQEGFSRDDLHWLARVVEPAAAAIQNARLFEGVQEAEVQLRGLLRTVINAQEEERRRVVAEWHDRLGAKLFSVFQGLRACQDLVLQRVPECTERFEQLAAELDTISAIVRGFTNELYSSVLDDFGFVAALREYIDGLRERELFRVTIQADEVDHQLPTAANLTLFRIVQEALLNIRKHAQARHVQIAFVQEHSGVSLMIKDDGQGFNPERLPRGHYGLLYMRERAEACGGTFQVRSARGQGTEVRVNFPLSHEDL